jgi:hypothetical protein
MMSDERYQVRDSIGAAGGRMRGWCCHLHNHWQKQWRQWSYWDRRCNARNLAIFPDNNTKCDRETTEDPWVNTYSIDKGNTINEFIYLLVATIVIKIVSI